MLKTNLTDTDSICCLNCDKEITRHYYFCSTDCEVDYCYKQNEKVGAVNGERN